MSQRDLGKILVTGADGFIGSHLVETLLERDYEVTALCLYNSEGRHGWLENAVIKAPKNLRPILGDIRDKEFIDNIMKNQNTVFHLAALIAIPFSYVAPRSYIDTNVTGSMNVAHACLQAKVGRLVHTSTSEVYGSAQAVPINEDHPLRGQSPYSASKIAADKVIESFFCSFDLPSTTLRPFNTYGPRQSLRAVIPTVIAQLLGGARELRLGNLKPTRDFNFVADTVEAFISLARHSGEDILGQTYNAGTGKEISISQFVELATKTLNRDANIVQDLTRVRPGKSEVERLIADASRLKSTTGWHPRVPLEEGISRFANWIKPRLEQFNVKKYHT